MTVGLRRGCQIYQFQFEYQGRRYYKSTGKRTRREAERFEREEMRRVKGMAAPPPVPIHAESANALAREPATTFGRTFNRVADHYYRLDGSSTENARALQSQLTQAIALVGPHTQLAEIDDHKMLSIRQAFEASASSARTRIPGRRAGSSVNDTLRLIVRVRNFGRDILGCPVHEIHPKRWLREESERIREIPPVDEARLMLACREELVDVIRFGILTGLRESALCRLRWPQIDFHNAHIRVELKGKRGKKRIHTMHLVDEAVAILLRQRGLLPEFVFSIVAQRPSYCRGQVRPEGTRIPLLKGTLKKLFAQAVRSAGLSDYCVHDLRHTAATRLLRASGNLDIVRKFLGHVDIKSTQRYAKMVMEDVKQAQQAMAGLDLLSRRHALETIDNPTEANVIEGLDLRAKLEAHLRELSRVAVMKNLAA